MTAIDDKYAELDGENGILGKATTGEHICAWPDDDKGRYRHFENGSIFFYPTTGAHEVHGWIHDKWIKLKAERGFLHYPKTDESPSGGGADGRFNLFQGGAITWKSGATEAFETHGAIRSKFGETGFEAGFLGFPTTDESFTDQNLGRFNHFEHGSIYWKKSISAHEIHGRIKDFWAEHGFETNPELGYPISDELPSFAASPHRFNDFENGVVYWHSGAASANQLIPFPGSTVPVDQVVGKIKKGITDKITNEHIYIKSGPSLAKITDYSFDGTKVRNRMYKIRIDVGVNFPYVPDPTSTVDMWFEVAFDRPSGTITTSLHHAQFHTHVPWPTSEGLSASQVNAKIKALLDPLVGVPQDTKTLPNTFHLLSAKVQANGDLNIFVAPLLG
jgi:LGFP repeat